MITDVLLIVVTIIYCVFIGFCFYRWKRLKEISGEKLKLKPVKVAVIVPARNESENITVLLECICKQDFPIEHFSVIVSDDHSDDDTMQIAKSVFEKNGFKNYCVVSSPNPSKKNAITHAVNLAEAELIITADADVIVGTQWISSIVSHYAQSRPVFIAGPVRLLPGYSFFERLQAMEFAGLIGIGAAGISARLPIMCNGANLAFTKKLFEEVGGYENSLSVSGDDTQLMRKANLLYPGRISFLKDSRAIATTRGQTRVANLLSQRNRWASKIPYTLSPFTIFIACIAWLVHAMLFIQIFAAFVHMSFYLLTILLFVKIFIESLLMNSTCKFLGDKFSLWIAIVAQPLYCLYITTMGILAPFVSFEWKERKT